MKNHFTAPLILNSQITPQEVFLERRQLIRAAALGTFGASLMPFFARQAFAAEEVTKLAAKANPQFVLKDKQTALKDASSYTNFYEFGTGKADPLKNAGSLITRPWTVSIEGLVKTPKVWDIEDLLKLAPQEERIYRLRCVEGWSMVIPWIGYSLADFIRKVEPTSAAKYIEFTTLADKKQMNGLSVPVLQWPYTEGLRMDEAMNPLTLLAFGFYGQVLPKQNGAPIRLVVPWKYGFKSIKSIVKIRFTDKEPKTSWSLSAPDEYGFYANVNPNVDHPRWSQASEIRIEGGGRSLFTPKQKTLPFNGYAEQVASLYQGMDLKRFF